MSELEDFTDREIIDEIKLRGLEDDLTKTDLKEYNDWEIEEEFYDRQHNGNSAYDLLCEIKKKQALALDTSEEIADLLYFLKTKF